MSCMFFYTNDDDDGEVIYNEWQRGEGVRYRVACTESKIVVIGVIT